MAALSNDGHCTGSKVKKKTWNLIPNASAFTFVDFLYDFICFWIFQLRLIHKIFKTFSTFITKPLICLFVYNVWFPISKLWIVWGYCIGFPFEVYLNLFRRFKVLEKFKKSSSAGLVTLLQKSLVNLSGKSL